MGSSDLPWTGPEQQAFCRTGKLPPTMERLPLFAKHRGKLLLAPGAVVLGGEPGPHPRTADEFHRGGERRQGAHQRENGGTDVHGHRLDLGAARELGQPARVVVGGAGDDQPHRGDRGPDGHDRDEDTEHPQRPALHGERRGDRGDQGQRQRRERRRPRAAD